MKTVYFVRHGESIVNVADTYIESHALGLTEKGREQAHFIGTRAARLPIDAIVSSTMERTRETTAIIRQYIDIEPVFSDLFVERRMPTSQGGKSKSDLDAKKTMDAWSRSCDGIGARMEDGEHFDDLKIRADAALRFLEECPAEHILLVGHGYFGRVLMARMLCGEGLTGAQFYPFSWGFRTKNAGLSLFRYDENDKYDRAWHVLVWNDHAHLG